VFPIMLSSACLPTSSQLASSLPVSHSRLPAWGFLLKRASACFTLLLPQTQLSLQGQVRKKDALIDKLRAQLTRAEAKYRARLDAAHSPGGCCLPCMHASDEIHAC